MWFLVLLICISGGFFLFFDYTKRTSLKYIFKPLTTVLVIGFALLQEIEVSIVYKQLIIAGLVFSLIGDVFLMLAKDHFKAGLASFLVAHLFYIVAFAGDFGPYYEWMFLIPVIVYAFFFLRKILPFTCRLKVPVIVYSLVIGVFLWQAMGRAWFLGDHSPQYALLGALLFVSSDSVLAQTYFIKSYKWSQMFILSTYWAAQVFIASSI